MKELDDYVERLSEISYIKTNPISVIYKSPKPISAAMNKWHNMISNNNDPKYIKTLKKYRIKESYPFSYVKASICLLYHRIIPISNLSNVFKEMMEDLNENY